MLRSELFSLGREKMGETNREALAREAEWLHNPSEPGMRQSHEEWLAIYTKRVLCAHQDMSHFGESVKCGDCGSQVTVKWTPRAWE